MEDAGSVTIELAEGSENAVRSGEPVELSADAADPDASGGAIHAKDDLTIAGAGKLTVRGYLNNGIHCSNRLTLAGGEIDVEAVNNGVKGKDGVTLTGGTLGVRCGGDGVESDSEDGAGFGVVEFAGGEISIESVGDGVQAATELTVSGGVLNIISGGGSAAAEPKQGERMGRGAGWDRDDEDDAPSAKGLKAGEKLTVSGGEISIDAADDALHSDGTLTISGGALHLATGDDGAHADDALTIADGTLEVASSYEGIEANQILISGGDIDVTANDDGVNANGGSSAGFGMGGGFGGMRGADGMGKMRGAPGEDTEDAPDEMPGGAPNGPGAQGSDGMEPPAMPEGEPPAAPGAEQDADAEPLPSLRITGGKLYVNAEGDGLDSNGDLQIEGGEIVVDGPSRSGNGALDSGGESGGACRVDGGVVLAIGASGMAESFDGDSGQPSLYCDLEGTVPAGAEIAVADADGNVLFSHVAAKSFSSVVFSCPELVKGETYVVTAGDARAEVEAGAAPARSGGRFGWRQ